MSDQGLYRLLTVITMQNAVKIKQQPETPKTRKWLTKLRGWTSPLIKKKNKLLILDAFKNDVALVGWTLLISVYGQDHETRKVWYVCIAFSVSTNY